MTSYLVTAQNKLYNGTVGDLQFKDGVYEGVVPELTLAYLANAGYGVQKLSDVKKTQEAKRAEQADADRQAAIDAEVERRVNDELDARVAAELETRVGPEVDARVEAKLAELAAANEPKQPPAPKPPAQQNGETK